MSEIHKDPSNKYKWIGIILMVITIGILLYSSITDIMEVVHG